MTDGQRGPRRDAPGTEQPRRFRPRLRYELLACGLHGHELVGTDAAEVRDEDALFARETDGIRWYRCLRCDAWLTLAPPEHPSRPVPPAQDEIVLPLRGRPLRDRFVLRTIAVERLFHLLVLAALDVAIFAFADHRRSLKHEYTRILSDLQGTLGGPLDQSKHGILHDLNRLFAVATDELLVLGAALALYCAVLLAEMIGLWWARRWAEYLTFAEAGVLIPFEIYEMVAGVTVLKVIGLLLNLAIVVYLAVAHRLFGVRGGAAAEHEEQERDRGWDPIVAAGPG